MISSVANCFMNVIYKSFWKFYRASAKWVWLLAKEQGRNHDIRETSWVKRRNRKNVSTQFSSKISHMQELFAVRINHFGWLSSGNVAKMQLPSWCLGYSPEMYVESTAIWRVHDNESITVRPWLNPAVLQRPNRSLKCVNFRNRRI